MVQNSWLSERREERAQRWASFMTQMTSQSQEIDDKHAQDMQRLHKYYKDLEEKLKMKA